MRRNYKKWRQNDFRGGVNTEPENAKANQVLDARNVWAPEGRLVQRPGFKSAGALPLPVGLPADGTIAFQHAWYIYTTGMLFTGSDPGLVDNDASHWPGAGGGGVAWTEGDYFYFAPNTDIDVTALASFSIDSLTIAHSITDPDDVAAGARWQYYNGTEWKTIYGEHMVATNFSTGTGIDLVSKPEKLSSGMFEGTNLVVFGEIPSDWAKTTVASTSRYWLRLSTTSVGTTGAYDALAGGGTTIVANSLDGYTLTDEAFWGAQVARTARTQRIYGIYNGLLYVLDSPSARNAAEYDLSAELHKATFAPSIASVPQFEDVYLAYNHRVFHMPTGVGVGVKTGELQGVAIDEVTAQVENDEAFVGETTVGTVTTKALFNRDQVPQLAAWPEANFTTFFDNRLWCANIKGQPNTIRWSGYAPFHRVWPEESNEILMEDDDSEITGMTSLGEHLLVFKNDSIWRMVSLGEGPIDSAGRGGLGLYNPVKVISGVGCVAESTIQRTPAGLIFLHEDGVYLFNGVQAQKISGDVDTIMSNLTEGARQRASSVHWSTQNCYIISIPTEGESTNKLTLVYDYKHGSWWVWDNFDAASWISWEDGTDNEQIFFIKNNGTVFKMGDSSWGDNQTATTAYIKTHRLGPYDDIKKVVRQVRVNGSNQTNSLIVEVEPDDAAGRATSGTMTTSDTNEAKFGTAVFGTAAFANPRRREKKLMFRESCQWATVKVTNSQAGGQLEVQDISVGWVPKGER